MNRTGFVVFDKGAYYYPLYDNCLYPFITGFGYKFIKKITKELYMSVPKFWLNKDIRKYERLVVTDSAMSVGLGKALNKIYGRDRIALYYMNSITERNAPFMEFFDVVKTYSKEDAKEYNIGYKHTPYGDTFSEKKDADAACDVIFLGMEKDRGDDIRKIYELLTDSGFKCSFMVPGMKDDRMGIKRPVDYDSYLKMVAESDCIAEIVGKGQRGVTLRFMEALFFKKKLITNNPAVLTDEYYDPENMYVLDSGREDVGDFLKGTYKDNSPDIERLELNNWLGSFWD